MYSPYIIAVIASLTAAVVNLYFWYTHRSVFDLLKGIIWVYLFFVYILATTPSRIDILRAGWLTVGGVVMLALLCVLDVVTRRR